MLEGDVISVEAKVEHAEELIKKAVNKYERIAVACSFGKDSMTIVHLSRQIAPEIPVFSIMTQYKPRETFEYLRRMNREMNLCLRVYIVADSVPEILKDDSLEVILLSTEEFKRASSICSYKTGKPIYEVNHDECCKILKVEPTSVAVKNLDAWITGLRNTEGRVREDYEEVEKKGALVKINPILYFTEEDVLNYLQENNIPLHPWYTKKFPDGRRYRSLGCEPCTKPIFPEQLERDGRWQGTSKCGGECGIHTQTLKLIDGAGI